MNRTLVLILFVLCSSLGLMADRYVCFDRYTVNEGLISDQVNELMQDKSGHLWVATDCGLLRYDGNSFKAYTTTNCPSLLKNGLSQLYTYPDGSFFLGGAQGVVMKYDEKADTFINVAPSDYKDTYYKMASQFVVSQTNQKLLCTSGGFYIYNEDSSRFVNQFPAYEKVKDLFLLSMYEDKFHRYWLSSFNTLWIVDSEGNILQKLSLAEEAESPMFSSLITPITDNHILVSCFSNVIYSFEIAESGEISYEKVQIPFSNLNSVLIDKNGNFWYSTDGYGLWYSEGAPSKNMTFERVRPTDDQLTGLDKLYIVRQTSNGDIWVGAYSSGLWRFNPSQQKTLQSSVDWRFPWKMASSFVEDEEHNVYVSCDGGGFGKLSPDGSSFVSFEESHGLTNRNVVYHSKDKNGHIWIATWGGGILEFDPAMQRYRRERFNGLNTNLSCFFSVDVMDNGEVWVCTGGDGLYVRDVDGKWRRQLLQFSENEFDMWPLHLANGGGDVRWIATSRSLWYVNGKEMRPLMGDFSKDEGYNSLRIADVVADGRGGAFVAVGHHILHYDEKANQCDTLDFIPLADYVSLCVDRNGLLYASGSKGIMSIDYPAKTYHEFPFDFSKKGLNYFRGHSVAFIGDDRLFWGTKEGFVVQSLVDSVVVDDIESFSFTDLRISDLTNRERESYLKRDNEGNIKSITVPYDKSNVSVMVDFVDFSDMGYSLSYCLKGFSDKWVMVPPSRKIEFSYLPEGDYQLIVKLDSKSGELKRIELGLTILPPWWHTWWFILLALLSIGLLVGGFFYLRMRRMEIQRNILQKMVDERTRELDEKKNFIEHQNEELRQVLSDKDRVLSVIAHDLKNPMFAIVGALEGWIRKEPSMDNEEKRGVITKVLASSQSLQNEMGRLLEWARAKNTEIEFKPSAVDLRSAIDNVGSLLSTLLSKKSINWLVDGDLQHCAWVDGRMISTIFRNFVNNAIKFTPEGGSIKVSLKENDNHIAVTIVDSGVGMSADKLEQLQSQGYCQSTLGTDNEKGTGLGFRICYDYVQRNAGTLQLSSVEGKGTTIEMTFPKSDILVSQLTPQIQEDKTRIEESIDKDVLEGNIVVVVDDDPLICRNVATILEEYMEVLTASNGEEALALIQSHEVDLVLSDVEMPVMNGIELSRHLAHGEGTSAIPFLFLSARNEQSDRLLGLLSGAIDYIPKPFSASELLMKVNNILRLRRKQQVQLLRHNLENVQNDVPVVESVEEVKVNPFVERVMKVIEDNYSDSTFSIEQLASAMNVSQSTLARKLKSLLNKTSIEILNEYRLNKSLSLLKDIAYSEKSIAEIAFEVGFTEPAYFSRKFKDFFGYLPSAAKK